MLKDARDHSWLTRKTPIISAGMISAPNGEKLSDNKSEDMVGLPATMTFLRANGLDSLVDGCGIHTYPSSDHPDDPAAARRTARFETVDLRFMPPRGSAKGEALLVYRMGFPEQRLFVSVEGLGPDARGSEKADEFCQSSRGASAGGYRLLGVKSDPWSKQPDADNIYRCGGLTKSGQLAERPLTDLPNQDAYRGYSSALAFP